MQKYSRDKTNSEQPAATVCSRQTDRQTCSSIRVCPFPSRATREPRSHWLICGQPRAPASREPAASRDSSRLSVRACALTGLSLSLYELVRGACVYQCFGQCLLLSLPLHNTVSWYFYILFFLHDEFVILFRVIFVYSPYFLEGLVNLTRNI